MSLEVELVGVEVGVVCGAEQCEVGEVGGASVFVVDEVVYVASIVGNVASVDGASAAVTDDHGESLEQGGEPA